MRQTGDNPQRAVSFWPREHGAYVQLFAPMLCALLFVRPEPASLAVALLACAAFVAHEPLLVLLGERGNRAKRELGERARSLLFRLGALASVAIAAVALSAEHALSALLVPLALVGVALTFVLSGRERSLLGELIGAAALASFSVPLLVASQVPIRLATLFSIGWFAVHGLATWTARAYVYRKRVGRAGLYGAAAASVVTLVLCGALAHGGWLPLAWPVAVAPFVVISLLLMGGLVTLKSPKQLGWLLAASNLVPFVAFGLSLR